MNPTFLSYIVVIDNFAIGQGRYLKKPLKSTKITHQRFFFYLFFQIDIYVTGQHSAGVLGKIVGWNHTIGDSMVYVEIWYLSTDKRIKIHWQCPAPKCVVSFTFQLSCAGATKNEDQLAFYNKAMDLIQQLRHFGYLIYDDQRAFRLFFQHLIKCYWAAEKPFFYTCVKQVNENCIRKLLMKNSRFSCLTGTKQENTTI